jgi:hypothetical protein
VKDKEPGHPGGERRTAALWRPDSVFAVVEKFIAARGGGLYTPFNKVLFFSLNLSFSFC